MIHQIRMRFRRLAEVFLFWTVAGFSLLNGQALELPLIFENRLDNGLKTVLIPMQGREDAAVTLLIRCGIRDEIEDRQAGLSKLLSLLMAERIRSRYDSLLTAQGLRLYSHSGWDHIEISLYGPILQLEGMLRLMSSDLDQPEFEQQVRRTALNRHSAEQPAEGEESMELRAALRHFFSEHPYSRGTEDILPALSGSADLQKEIREFYERSSRPDNAMLFVSGGFNRTGDLSMMLSEYFGSWKSGYKPRVIPDMPEHKKGFRSTETQSEKASGHIVLVWKLPGLQQDMRAAASAYLLDRYLFSRDSELNAYLLRDAAVLKSMKHRIHIGRDASLMVLEIELNRSRDIDFTLEYIGRVLSGDRRTTGFASLHARRIYENSDQYLNRSPLHLNRLLGPFSAVNGDVKDYFLFRKTLESLTLNELQQLQKSRLKMDAAWLMIREGQEK